MTMHESFILASNASEFSRRIRLDPDPWQDGLLTSGWLRKIINCSRQSGKTTTVATKVLHKATMFAKSLSLVFSPTQRQSMELQLKVNEGYNSASIELPAKEQDSKTEIRFDNGSRIVSLPGTQSTVRGYSAPDLIVIDEAAYVPDELYSAIRPMMATNPSCELVLTSTPHGKQGFFYDTWMSERGWEKYEVPATDCPRITKEFLDEERAALGDILFMQEYFCQFVDIEEQIFLTDLVESIFAREIEPLHSNLNASVPALDL